MKVYFSYALADRELAQKIARRLVGDDHEVFDPAVEVLPGDNWGQVIGKALATSEAMVVLLSLEAVKSPHVMQDVQFALGSPNYEGRVIPVLVRPTDGIPWFLDTLQKVDLRSTTDPASKVAKALQRTARKERV